MRPEVFAATVLVCLLGIPTIVSAQAAPPEPGARIRLTVPCDLAAQPAPGRRNECVFVGKLTAWRTDAIDLEEDGRPSTYDLKTVSQLEVSRGIRSNRRLGAGIGFVVGVGTTYYLFQSGGSTGKCNQSKNQDAIDAGPCLGIYALGGLAGAGLGAFIGSAITSERWQRVSHGPVRLSVGTQGRLALRLAVTF